MAEHAYLENTLREVDNRRIDIRHLFKSRLFILAIGFLIILSSVSFALEIDNSALDTAQNITNTAGNAIANSAKSEAKFILDVLNPLDPLTIISMIFAAILVYVIYSKVQWLALLILIVIVEAFILSSFGYLLW